MQLPGVVPVAIREGGATLPRTSCSPAPTSLINLFGMPSAEAWRPSAGRRQSLALADSGSPAFPRSLRGSSRTSCFQSASAIVSPSFSNGPGCISPFSAASDRLRAMSNSEPDGFLTCRAESERRVTKALPFPPRGRGARCRIRGAVA